MNLSLNPAQVRAHLRSLAAVAAADGRIAPAEHQFILSIGDRHGVPRRELDNILSSRGKVMFAPPQDPRLRLAQLIDLVQMMVCDGEIEGRELHLCHSFASAMGFDPDVVAKITAALIVAGGAGQQQRAPTIDAESFLEDDPEPIVAELVFHCPQCAVPFAVLPESLGQTVVCHACECHIALPESV